MEGLKTASVRGLKGCQDLETDFKGSEHTTTLRSTRVK